MTAPPPPDLPQGARYPDLRDPRVLVAVPRDRRDALTAIWALAARLTRLLDEAREPLIGQIKLAWWRDMMQLVAKDPVALPKGEPLLAELSASWGGAQGLDGLVDAAEAMLLADDAWSCHAAAQKFGAYLFNLSSISGRDDARGRRWGLVWGAMLDADMAQARALLCDACNLPPAARVSFKGDRALLILDRWALAIAQAGGDRHLRREGLLLLRLGIFGR